VPDANSQPSDETGEIKVDSVAPGGAQPLRRRAASRSESYSALTELET
jgi:hypothetical protein